MKKKLGILLSGRGSNMKAILHNCQAHTIEAEVAVVISNKASAAGLRYSQEAGIPSHSFNPKAYPHTTAYEQALVNCLKEHQVDLVILAGYMKLIHEPLLNAFPQRIMNIHPSLLPAFKGLDAQKQALDYGVKIAGCSVHFVEKEMDAGPIILQATIPVSTDDTAESLSKRLLQEEHRIYSQAIQLFCEKKLEIQGRHVQIQA